MDKTVIFPITRQINKPGYTDQPGSSGTKKDRQDGAEDVMPVMIRSYGYPGRCGPVLSPSPLYLLGRESPQGKL